MKDYKTTSALLQATRFDAEFGKEYVTDLEPEPEAPEGEGWRLICAVVDGLRVLWFWERERKTPKPWSACAKKVRSTRAGSRT